ncbi:MAG: hypothetical protein GX418_12960 [Clostridiales bacterium]|nr:hypothetical protein [Clostridiales bacterium]
MESKEEPLRTGTLWSLLMDSPTFSHFIETNAESLDMPAFSVFITDLCRQRGEPPERVIRRSGIERSFGHQLFRGTRNPSRDTVLLLAFGFQADIELAQTLLKYARCGQLYPRVRRDALISFCLFHRYDLIQTQNLLAEKGMVLLGGDRTR